MGLEGCGAPLSLSSAVIRNEYHSNEQSGQAEPCFPAQPVARPPEVHEERHDVDRQRATRSLISAAGTRIEYFSRAVLTKATPNKPRDSPSISSPVRKAGLWFKNMANIDVSHSGFI
jgi:hypothetical protein